MEQIYAFRRLLVNSLPSTYSISVIPDKRLKAKEIDPDIPEDYWFGAGNDARMKPQFLSWPPATWRRGDVVTW
jgi:hypothetical protein